jgi:hypothetical protein
METIAIVVLMFIGLLIADSLFRHFKLLTMVVFLILPVILLPVWVLEYQFNWFFWVKMFSVTFGISLLFVCGNTRFSQSRWIYSAIWLAFAINIAEAMLYDILASNSLQFINVLTGCVLIATLPGPGTMKIDQTTPIHDFSWDISYGWIVTYTLWNWIFVYGNWPGMGARHHIAVLGASLFIALFNRTLWAEARAFTLGTYFMTWFLFKPTIDQVTEMPSWYNSNFYLIIASLTLCYALVLLFKKVKKWAFQPENTPHQLPVGSISSEKNII